MPDTAAPTDEDLLARARQGEQQAFRALVERYEVDGKPLTERYPALDYVLG